MRTSAWIGPCCRPSAVTASRDRVDDRSLSRVIEPRRCHVDRLLEEWTGQRIGLVEDGDHLENSLVHKAFERYLNPVHVALDKHRGHRSVGADLAKQ